MVAGFILHKGISMTDNLASIARSRNPCEHFGGQIPSRIDSRRTWIYRWCLRARQLSTKPRKGRAHWGQMVPARMAPMAWTRGPPCAPT